MNAIVSVTQNWGIGLKGQLLVRNREDMRYFRDHTMGGTIVCGRTTFESFPGGALKNRRNVVLSGDPAFAAPGIEVARNVEEALALVEEDDPQKVWLIGGERVYRQLLPLCTHAHVTKNAVTLPADAYFPNLDNDASWHTESILPGGTTPEGISYAFHIYRHVPNGTLPAKA